MPGWQMAIQAYGFVTKDIQMITKYIIQVPALENVPGWPCRVYFSFTLINTSVVVI